MTRFRVAPGVVVDRHYRGALVWKAGETYALDEASAIVLEQVQAQDPSLIPCPQTEALAEIGLIQPVDAPEGTG